MEVFVEVRHKYQSLEIGFVILAVLLAGPIPALAFGVSFAAPALEAVSLTSVAYAVLSLTVIRMVPVALSLAGTGLRWPTVLFLGWFGPRGLASILFGILIVNELELPHETLIFNVVMLTVLLSVVAHGVTAAPFARRYAQMATDPEHCPAEHAPVMSHPLRMEGSADA